MYLGKPGYKFNGGCTMLRQEIIETVERRSASQWDVRAIVLAFTSEGSPEPFVTWDRWVTFEAAPGGHRQVAESCSFGHYFRELNDETVADFDNRVEKFTRAREYAKAIRQRGLDDGSTAASWLVDGSTKDPFKVLSDIMSGIEDGDPAILDALPEPRVGGENADDPTWEDICQAEIERYDDGEDKLYAVYVEAFHDGVLNEIARMWDGYRPDWSVKS